MNSVPDATLEAMIAGIKPENPKRRKFMGLVAAAAASLAAGTAVTSCDTDEAEQPTPLGITSDRYADSDADSDSDTDSDSDADADGDSDADTDSDTLITDQPGTDTGTAGIGPDTSTDIVTEMDAGNFRPDGGADAT